jgi:hypothetical protein
MTQSTTKSSAVKKIIVLAMLVIANCTGMFAQTEIIMSDKDGWHKIGETTVDFKTETHEISLMGADRFGYIKFKVTEAPIHLSSFDIYFETGDKQSVTIGKEIKNPGESRSVEIEGGERNIKKIIFVYKTVANQKDKKAHVEIWGMKTNPDKKNK